MEPAPSPPIYSPNKQNPDSGIETATRVQGDKDDDPVQTNRLPTQGLKQYRIAAFFREMGSPNKPNPDSGIETPTVHDASRSENPSPNKQNPDSGIETVMITLTVYVINSGPNKQNPDSGIETW